jgi:hypothetical protein
VRRSLSQALRFLNLGSDSIRRRIPAPAVFDISILLTELGEPLITEDEQYLVLEQVVE